MDLIRRLLADESGQAAQEYAIVFVVFAIAAIIGVQALTTSSSHALQGTRAREMCTSITQQPNTRATTDSAGNVSCN